MKVYYVSATHGEAGQKHLLGKFPAVDGDLVAQSSADGFAKSLSPAHWRNVVVNVEEEPQASQHVLHGGKVGA